MKSGVVFTPEVLNLDNCKPFLNLLSVMGLMDALLRSDVMPKANSQANWPQHDISYARHCVLSFHILY